MLFGLCVGVLVWLCCRFWGGLGGFWVVGGFWCFVQFWLVVAVLGGGFGFAGGCLGGFISCGVGII